MEPAILVVWALGLVGALGATLTILKQVALILGTLRDIERLAHLTRVAADRLVVNLEPVTQLEPLAERVERLRDATRTLIAAGGKRKPRREPVAGGSHRRTVMGLFLTIVSVLGAWAFLTVLVLGLLFVLKPLESIRGYMENVTMGVRAIERQTLPLARHAEAVAASLAAAEAAVGGAARRLQGLERGAGSAEVQRDA